MAAESHRRRASFAVQLGSFVVILGVPSGLLGTLWPTMRASLHRPLADLAELVIASTVLYFVGGLVAARVERALALRATLVLSTVLALAALLAWTFAPVWAVVLCGLALLGLVQGILDAVLNAAAALDGGVRRLGLLHASWALGGTLGPLLVATLAAAGDWRAAVGAVCVAAALLVPLAALAPRQPSPVEREETGAPEARERHWSKRRRRLALAATAAACVGYVAAEFGPVSWGATYLTADRHLTDAAAAVGMAVFWGALTVGRLALALFHRLRPEALLEGSTLVFLAGLALLWLLPGRADLVGLPLAGLGSATIFPLLVALTPSRLGAEATGRAVGYAVAGAAAGSPVAVALFGLLAEHLGTAVLGPCMLGAGAVMYLTLRLLAVAVRSPGHPLVSPRGTTSS